MKTKLLLVGFLGTFSAYAAQERSYTCHGYISNRAETVENIGAKFSLEGTSKTAKAEIGKALGLTVEVTRDNQVLIVQALNSNGNVISMASVDTFAKSFSLFDVNSDQESSTGVILTAHAGSDSEKAKVKAKN